MFNAFKAQDKPTAVQFADGRTGESRISVIPTLYRTVEERLLTHSRDTEQLPDITALARPTVLGDVAAYFFFTAGGLFLGGETGLLTGSLSAGRLITKDPESRARIETAFRKFRADSLRQEADKLDGGGSLLNKVF